MAMFGISTKCYPLPLQHISLCLSFGGGVGHTDVQLIPGSAGMIHESLMAVLRGGPFGMPGMELGSAVCKASALPLYYLSSSYSSVFETAPS